jgi:putative oxidoreductase
MRVVLGIALIARSVTTLSGGPPMLLTVLSVLLIGAGLLLLAGLWTPIAGTLVATIEVWTIFLLPEDLWVYILLGTLGAGLALLGPGAWSVDAHLFGWKRVELPDRES